MKSSRVGSPQFAPISKLQPFPLRGNRQESDIFEDSGFVLPFYEPTSVLDPHLSSSPAASDNLLHDIPSLPPSCWDDTPLPSYSEDWDLVTWFLGGSGGEKDEPTPPPSFKPLHQFLDNQTSSSPLPHLPLYEAFSPVAAELNKMPCFDPAAPVPLVPSPSNSAAFNGYLVQLIRAAQAGDTGAAHSTLSAAAGGGRPVQRVACYFREALQSLLSHEHHTIGETLVSPVEMVHKITAYKAFSDLSPVLHFASFTANQTVLEAMDRSRSIHLIDFDVGLGGQWSSFMHEVAERCRAAAAPPPSIRITAVFREESLETRLSAENLRDFARGLGLEFSTEFLRVGSMGTPHWGLAARRRRRHRRQLNPRLLPPIREHARDRSAASPFHLPFVPSGGCVRRHRVLMPLFLFRLPRAAACPSAVLPQVLCGRSGELVGVSRLLDSAAAAVGLGDDQVCRIERFLVKPRVLASLALSLNFGGTPPWREMFEAAGMKPIPFSVFTESQAELLTRRSPVAGFQVERRDWSMVLGWRGKDLASTSAWRC
ncbi:unnamed protein product [Spirodela intermedia]|uniref:Uncharacterized protein n=1 Tax=Spirodela intermedia TaxID=51605 RepID=A0A7I8IIJ8_SPIIN|nr:unnamed protein product [Spirodela intermedia]CAA6657556.1 unnamed protein product [Spirodela intermedia]